MTKEENEAVEHLKNILKNTENLLKPLEDEAPESVKAFQRTQFKNYNAIKTVLSIIEEQEKKIRELERKQKENIVIVRDDTIKMYEQTEMDLESKITDLEIKNKRLKEDMKNMYNEEVVISIICDNFNLTRNEALDLLGD